MKNRKGKKPAAGNPAAPGAIAPPVGPAFTGPKPPAPASEVKSPFPPSAESPTGKTGDPAKDLQTVKALLKDEPLKSETTPLKAPTTSPFKAEAPPLKVPPASVKAGADRPAGDKKKPSENKKVLAAVGVVLGCLALLAVAVWLIVFAIKGVVNNLPHSAADNTIPPALEESQTQPQPQSAPTIGNPNAGVTTVQNPGGNAHPQPLAPGGGFSAEGL